MSFDTRLALLRKKLWRPRWRSTTPFFHLSAQANRCDLTVRLFYAINFFIWTNSLTVWQAGRLDSIIAQPVWPVFWVGLGNSDFWSSFFFVLNLFASSLVLLWPGFRSVRILAFLALLFESAILNSDLGGWERSVTRVYDIVLIAFLLIFLPGKNEKKRSAAWKTTFLIVMAQITILTSYGSSAIWRIRESILQFIEGRTLSIGPEAFLIFSKRFFTTDGTAIKNSTIGIVGKYLLEHKELTGPLMALGTLFELSCLFAICKPRLYRIYGGLIAMFQLTVILTLALPFNEHLLVALLFLTCTPLIDQRRMN